MAVAAEKFLDEHRGSANEAYDVQQQDARMTWLMPRLPCGCGPLAAETTGHTYMTEAAVEALRLISRS